jgi:hypothetical protein
MTTVKRGNYTITTRNSGTTWFVKCLLNAKVRISERVKQMYGCFNTEEEDDELVFGFDDGS